MQSKLQRIAVLGGGLVGWFAAAYLNRILNRFQPGAVEIIVLENGDALDGDPAAPGSPLLARSLSRLGIAESALLRYADATFMHAMRYVNWSDDPRHRPTAFYRPLDRIATVDGVELGHLWIANRSLSPHASFAYAVSLQPTLCDRLRSPKLAGAWPFEAPVEYSYQVDSIALLDYVRALATGRGVQGIAGRADAYRRQKDGGIAAVHMQDGRVLAADVFIDCEGAAMRVLDAGRRDAFLSYESSLVCDRMLTINLETAADDAIRPYFTARAAAAGWIGENDLATCRRMTYVYSSGFSSELAAERELRAYAQAADDLPIARARFEPGRRREVWQHNCLALGRAAGAIEPLVASELGHVEAMLALFVEHLPSVTPYDALRARCNEHLGAVLDAARDLTVLHYCLTRREDSAFWRANRHDIHVPDRLRSDLELWMHRLPSPHERGNPNRWCDHQAFQFALAGMDRVDGLRSPYDGYVSPELASASFRQLEKTRAQALASAPDHRAYIRGQRAHQIELDLAV